MFFSPSLSFLTLFKDFRDILCARFFWRRPSNRQAQKQSEPSAELKVNIPKDKYTPDKEHFSEY